MEFVLFRFDEELALKETLENQVDMLNVLLPRLGEDDDVVNVKEGKLI